MARGAIKQSDTLVAVPPSWFAAEHQDAALRIAASIEADMPLPAVAAPASEHDNTSNGRALHDGFVEIEFQITGPVERYRDYKPLTDSPLDRVTRLKEEGRLEEAVATLVAAVDAEEAEAKKARRGVGPWPYKELAVLYRKLKRHDDEVAILERYAALEKAPGRSQAELADRLLKARAQRDRRRSMAAQ